MQRLKFPSWALHKKSNFEKRGCPPGLGGQHDRRSCEGWSIKLINGVSSTTPAPIMRWPPLLIQEGRCVSQKLIFVQSPTRTIRSQLPLLRRYCGGTMGILLNHDSGRILGLRLFFSSGGRTPKRESFLAIAVATRSIAGSKSS